MKSTCRGRSQISPRAIARHLGVTEAQYRRGGGGSIRATSLNRELACLEHLFEIARKGRIELKGGVPTENRGSAVTFLDEQHLRDRVLTPEEFQRMVYGSPDYVRPVLHGA